MPNKDYVNPYSALAQYHKDGLDYIITNWDNTKTAEDLVNFVYDYLVTVYTELGSAVSFELIFKGIIANTINGYLNYGEGINPELRGEPVQYLNLYFERLEDSINTAATTKSPQSNNQFALTFGKASNEYWKTQVDNSATSNWTTYLTGNVATDLNDIPYWVSAAMFGSRYCFDPINSNSGEAVGSITITTLAGSLVVSAGKVLLKWVPKKNDTLLKDFQKFKSQGPITVGDPKQLGMDDTTAKSWCTFGSYIGANPDNFLFFQDDLRGEELIPLK